MCLYCHMLKKFRVGMSEIIFFLILLFFMTELMLDGILNTFLQSSKDITSPMSGTCKIQTGQVKFQDHKPDWACKIVESKRKKYWTKQTRIPFFKSKQGKICRSF